MENAEQCGSSYSSSFSSWRNRSIYPQLQRKLI